MQQPITDPADLTTELFLEDYETRTRLPIWLQLSLAITVLILFAVVALGAVTMKKQEENLYRQTLRLGTVSLNYFANNAGIPLIEENTLRLNTLIKEATAVEGIRFAVITDRNAIIRAHTDPRRLNTVYAIPETETEGSCKDDITHIEYTDSETGEAIIRLKRAIRFKDIDLGCVYVGLSVNFIDEVIREGVSSILMFTALVVGCGILTAVWLSFKFTRPILKLAAASDDLSKGRYNHRVELKTNDEIKDLARAFNRMSKELWLKSLMQESFGKYVGLEVLSMILENPKKPWVKGSRRRATILFADIRGFTVYSASREPEEIVEALNEYIDISLNTLTRYGFVDKLIGDAVLAVFGVPVARDNHELIAVRAAIELQKNLMAASGDHNPLLSRVGISINSGIVVAGNIGSQVKMEYTVIGSTVNIASKINRLAGPGDVVISDSVWEATRGQVLAEPVIIGATTKPPPVDTFRVLGLKETENVRTNA